MIEGLHTCKPGNEPMVGQVKTFVVIQNSATATKKAWTKIKSASPDAGGQPYKITAVKPTGHTDSYGNVSFNLTIEPTTDQAASQSSGNAPRNGFMTKDDYWQRKEDRDREWQAEQVRNKPRIERQHSQEMALRYLAMRPDQTTQVSTETVRELINWFQRDIDHSPAKPIAKQEPERTTEESF